MTRKNTSIGVGIVWFLVLLLAVQGMWAIYLLAFLGLSVLAILTVACILNL